MRRIRFHTNRALLCIGLLLFMVPAGVFAQGIRVSGLTTARYVDVKPITTQDRIGLVPLTQDLSVNAWGLTPGLRLYSQVRVRVSAGEESDIWPQADDNFDLLAAYAEYDRTSFRVRAGRQWKSSPLGFYNYDGGSVLVRPFRFLRAEVYGGWSLLAGESDGYDAVVGAIEPFKPEERPNIIGAELSLRFSPRVSVSGLYQREIRTDNAALYSERAAADASVGVGPLLLTGGMEYNLASQEINDARAQLSTPLFARMTGSVEVRRYRPYFDLWTIWGLFNPIGFEEALAHARWSDASGAVALHVGGGARRYRDDGAGVEFERLKEDGWRALADASWTPTRILTLNGSYRADIGFGASRSEGDLSARFNVGQSNYVSVTGLAFQSAYELDVREGTVLGVGTDASFKLNNAARVGWNLSIYRHNNASPAEEIDWNQVRGGVWLQWTVGTNPDVTRVARRDK